MCMGNSQPMAGVNDLSMKDGHHNVIKEKLSASRLFVQPQRHKLWRRKSYLQCYQGSLSKTQLPWGLDFVTYINRVFSLDDQNQIGKLSNG